ncbi:MULTISPECIES: GNAT family N-acetyltransferase [Staphylococcus]|uniref:GNAT family N-acetyltransferase n=1 Tax=Staphylococcus TaxID=1279 RepID=UPI00124DBB3D|nr:MULTISPECIES: GNAT family N-acetyltransferase [Staphylococcus]KAB2481025.1 GNAT family N-acetyltransferase [Staphylococcus sp. CH99b_3]MCD8839326.1 GNAT family N-acetyltransferase [Staphylococcus arlettae]MCD8866892.1 GNAT family N-acetyltransferase [Staphylococcus arlettae]
MELQVKSYEMLSKEELFNIICERIKVFVVEQQCSYQEVDSIDKQALHVFYKKGATIVAYTRIYEQDNAVHFGRVLVNQQYRGQDIGRQIVSQTINEINTRYPQKVIKIEGQTYLKAFYAAFGFQIVSEEYLEDGIPHFDMELKL